MKVSIFSEDGSLLWSREMADGQSSGFACRNYSRDGTQYKIINALSGALDEARGQLGSPPLEIVDAVTDVRPAAAKVDRHVPIAIVWNRDAGG
jgi:hypothetical protein